MHDVSFQILLRRQANAFTFVEVLAAMLFMAIVIPVTMEGITLANRVGVAASRKREAAALAERILTEAVATDSWRSGKQSGGFDADAPGYHWEITAEDWKEGPMKLVTTRVFYTVQEHEYHEDLSTLADLTQSTGNVENSNSGNPPSTSPAQSAR